MSTPASSMPKKKGGGFSKLPTWAKVALPAGGLLIVYYLYKKQQAAAAANTATTATGSTTPTTDTTGTTGDTGGGGGPTGGGGGGGGGLSSLLQGIQGEIAALQQQGPAAQGPAATLPGTPTANAVTANTTSASTGTAAVSVNPPSTPGTIGGTTANPNANVPTQEINGTVYSGIGNQALATSLTNRGFTLYKNVGGQYVPANSAAGKASKNKGLYYNPNQSGVK